MTINTRFSLLPDETMAWIYDPYHRDYHSDKAIDLRERRAAAIGSAPEWMIELARMKDAFCFMYKNKGSKP